MEPVKEPDSSFKDVGWETEEGRRGVLRAQERLLEKGLRLSVRAHGKSSKET